MFILHALSSRVLQSNASWQASLHSQPLVREHSNCVVTSAHAPTLQPTGLMLVLDMPAQWHPVPTEQYD